MIKKRIFYFQIIVRVTLLCVTVITTYSQTEIIEPMNKTSKQVEKIINSDNCVVDNDLTMKLGELSKQYIVYRVEQTKILMIDRIAKYGVLYPNEELFLKLLQLLRGKINLRIFYQVCFAMILLFLKRA